MYCLKILESVWILEGIVILLRARLQSKAAQRRRTCPVIPANSTTDRYSRSYISRFRFWNPSRCSDL